jgi:hypothetical protein
LICAVTPPRWSAPPRTKVFPKVHHHRRLQAEVDWRNFDFDIMKITAASASGQFKDTVHPIRTRAGLLVWFGDHLDVTESE